MFSLFCKPTAVIIYPREKIRVTFCMLGIIPHYRNKKKAKKDNNHSPLLKKKERHKDNKQYSTLIRSKEITRFTRRNDSTSNDQSISARIRVHRGKLLEGDRSKENSPSDAALSQTPGHPAAGGFCPETRGKKGLERITDHVTEGR